MLAEYGLAGAIVGVGCVLMGVVRACRWVRVRVARGRARRAPVPVLEHPGDGLGPYSAFKADLEEM